MKKIDLGDKVRVKKGEAGEGYTFYVTATGEPNGHAGDRLLYGGTFSVLESHCELVAVGRIDTMGR